jgi:hypothetical protein
MNMFTRTPAAKHPMNVGTLLNVSNRRSHTRTHDRSRF